jgi:hypothetical protein
MRAIVAAAAVLVLAWPVASADASDYGGGTPTDSGRQAPRQLTMVGIRTNANGTARMWIKVAARCGIAPVTGPITLAPDGSFAFRVKGGGRLPNGVRRSVTVRATGKVVGATASGTASARLTFRRHGRVTARCRSGTRTWQARVAAPQPAAAPPTAGGGYYGFTSQGAGRPFPFVLKVSPDARRVRTAVFDYRMRCRRNTYEFDNITPGAAVLADGSFHLSERFTQHYAEGNERYRVAVDGRFTTSGVSGTLVVTSVLRARGGGRVLDRCSTGATTFSALL